MRWVALAVLLLSARAFAQPDDPPVQEIEPEPEPKPEPKPQPPPARPEPARPAHVHTMDELMIPQSNLRFGINFFGDASLIGTTPDEPHSAFAIGALGIRLLGTLSPEVDALGELAFETTDEGPLADVEQVVIRWRHGSGVLEVGRMHTNIGYWNTAYHHGLWLQTPVERPRAVRFEDDLGLVPVHWVGASYTYNIGGVALTTGVANGRGNIVDDVRVSDDTNDAKAVLFKIRYRTQAFEVGAGGIYDRIAPASAMIRPALPGERIDEVIGNAYLAVTTDGPIAIAEGFAFRHAGGDDSWLTYTGYALAGYHVTDWLTPYVAVDALVGADEDPFFTPDPMMVTNVDLVEGIAGTRFETSTWSAVKLELRALHPEGADDVFTAVANWSFGL